MQGVNFDLTVAIRKDREVSSNFTIHPLGAMDIHDKFNGNLDQSVEKYSSTSPLSSAVQRTKISGNLDDLTM